MNFEDSVRAPGPRPDQPDLNAGSNELKFVLSPQQVEPVIEWARARVPADPHAGPGSDTYRVTTLYFDSADLGVYHRRPNYRRSKYRVRRYGDEDLLYLEEKRKVKGWVRKRRTLIPDADLDLLRNGDPGEWSGAWFRHLLERKGLVPQCQTTYERLARVGETEGQPVRLTVDRTIECAPQPECRVPAIAGEGTLHLDRTILELKFQKVLPRLFEELMREFHLEPESSSKYRLAIWHSGMAITAPEGRQ